MFSTWARVSLGAARSMAHRNTWALASCAVLATSLRVLQWEATWVSVSLGSSSSGDSAAAPPGGGAGSSAALRARWTTRSAYRRMGLVKWVYRSMASA